VNLLASGFESRRSPHRNTCNLGVAQWKRACFGYRRSEVRTLPSRPTNGLLLAFGLEEVQDTTA
jgi:hypothetical protein